MGNAVALAAENRELKSQLNLMWEAMRSIEQRFSSLESNLNSQIRDLKNENADLRALVHQKLG